MFQSVNNVKDFIDPNYLIDKVAGKIVVSSDIDLTGIVLMYSKIIVTN